MNHTKIVETRMQTTHSVNDNLYARFDIFFKEKIKIVNPKNQAIIAVIDCKKNKNTINQIAAITKNNCLELL